MHVVQRRTLVVAILIEAETLLVKPLNELGSGSVHPVTLGPPLLAAIGGNKEAEVEVDDARNDGRHERRCILTKLVRNRSAKCLAKDFHSHVASLLNVRLVGCLHYD